MEAVSVGRALDSALADSDSAWREKNFKVPASLLEPSLNYQASVADKTISNKQNDIVLLLVLGSPLLQPMHVWLGDLLVCSVSNCTLTALQSPRMPREREIKTSLGVDGPIVRGTRLLTDHQDFTGVSTIKLINEQTTSAAASFVVSPTLS